MELFRRLGARFRVVGWIAIALLVVTGIANLGLRGLLSRWPPSTTSRSAHG